MPKTELLIDAEIFTKAEQVLRPLGMDVEMAVSIYLRRIALENGLPMTMTSSVTKRPVLETADAIEDSFNDDSETSVRSNSKITTEMVDHVWLAFLRYHSGLGEINSLSTEVSAKTGMNKGSAFIYLNVLVNLVDGAPNTRVLKYKDLEYLMGKIKNELGDKKYQAALDSLKASAPYWREKISDNFADRVEAYCRKNWIVTRVP